MDLLLFVIPIQDDVEVPDAFVLGRDFIVLFDDACGVLFVFLAGVCDAKIIDAKRELDRTYFVEP